MNALGWDEADFVFVTGDAYVDHPSFGCAILTRTLEAAGWRVAVLPQPSWRDDADFRRFGRPRYGFFVSSGVIDSMVNHYTAARRPRSEDSYSPGGKRGFRPDRALIVYCNRIRQAYGSIPVVIGGIEASLRRFAHYDYWDNAVRRSVLEDAGADILLFGMGETSIVETARLLSSPDDWRQKLPSLRGACFLTPHPPEGYKVLPSYRDVAADKTLYAQAFMAQSREQDAVRGVPLAQFQEDRWLCQNPPSPPLSREALDRTYALPYMRAWHPMYDAQGGVPALSEVEFSIASTRGCFGSCSFCALSFHQGRTVSSRSPDSIVAEARELTASPHFKGYIHDVGGPTANFRRPSCERQLRVGTCPGRTCLYPSPCPHLKADHSELLTILRRLRALPGVKKVFIRSGIRYDYLLADKNTPFLKELCRYHVSGQLKVAPEHVSPRVLALMGKPSREVYDRFVQKYKAVNEALGLRQYLVPYLMSSHPGSDLAAAVELAEYLRDTRQQPEQVQDFYPTPGTLSTCMFWTGLDPRTMEPVYVPRDPEEKAMQRALLQFRDPRNAALCRKALRLCGRDDLIGRGGKCLVPPERQSPAPGPAPRPHTAQGTPARKGRAPGPAGGSRSGVRSKAAGAAREKPRRNDAVSPPARHGAAQPAARGRSRRRAPGRHR